MAENGKPAVQAHNLSLKYRLRSEERQTLKWAFMNFLKGRSPFTDFWALNDISFTIPRGETWGIVGVNGSGKSTLLKLITGILKPDRGELVINGIVSALLELGAGFQPDLTGRENIFLNGSLLGLSRADISSRMDKIIDFSGVGKFIDTPVKHYSSGMYMRLGFSIAINVDPDILLIDEIFAVGDLKFQEKCMDKINQFKAENKSIILVSHDMNAVRSLCDNALWLNNGRIEKMGRINEVIDYYKNHILEQQDEEALVAMPDTAEQRWGTGTVKITDVELKNSEGKTTRNYRHGDQLTVTIRYSSDQTVEKPVFGIALHRNDGTHICGPNTKLNNFKIDSIKGQGEITYTIDSLPLLPGKYQLSAVVYDHACVVPYDHLDRMFPFTVIEDGAQEIYGVISLGGTWRRKDQ